MQCAEYQMACKSGLDGYLSCFGIPYFTHHYNIRVLPEDMPECPRERKVYLLIYSYLDNALYIILNRVLCGYNLVLYFIYLAQARIKRGGLSAACRPCCKKNPIGPLYYIPDF